MEKIGFKNKFYLGPFQKYFIVFCCKYYMFITHVRHLNNTINYLALYSFLLTFSDINLTLYVFVF